MAADVFIVTGSCRATKAPFVNDSGTFLKIRVAWTTRGTDDDGEWVDKSNYGNVVVLGKRAGAIADYIDKGTQMVVTGPLENDNWTNDAGDEVTDFRIIANEIQLVGGRRDDDDGGGRKSSGRSGGRSGGGRKRDDDWD